MNEDIVGDIDMIKLIAKSVYTTTNQIGQLNKQHANIVGRNGLLTALLTKIDTTPGVNIHFLREYCTNAVTTIQQDYEERLNTLRGN